MALLGLDVMERFGAASLCRYLSGIQGFHDATILSPVAYSYKFKKRFLRVCVCNRVGISFFTKMCYNLERK